MTCLANVTSQVVYVPLDGVTANLVLEVRLWSRTGRHAPRKARGRQREGPSSGATDGQNLVLRNSEQGWCLCCAMLEWSVRNSADCHRDARKLGL